MTKQHFKRALAVLLILVVSLCAVPGRTYASQSTRDKYNEATKNRDAAKDKVKEQQDEVDGLNARKKELKRELNKLNAELDSICERISELDAKIAAKEQEIAETQAALDEARTIEHNQYEAMKKRIQFMYKDSRNLYLDIIFQAKSFTDLITLSSYMEALATYDKDKFDEYQETRKIIEILEAKLQGEKADLDVLMAEAQDEKAKVMEVVDRTKTKVSEYNDLIDEAEAELLAYEADLKAKEADLAAIKKQLEEELRLSALAARSVWRDISDITFDAGDRYLLAVLIYCEAGGEPYEGKVAVGAVVINRVRSSVYPSTVVEVIRQRKQFSPVGSGRFDYYCAIGKTNQDCYNAADAAMSGVTNVGDCLHFRTPIEGLTGIQIGNHIFY